MKILFVGHECDLNGASLSMLGIIDQLAKDNSIYVLTSYKSGEFIEELKKRNVNIIQIKYYRWMIFKSKNKIKWNIQRIQNLLLCQVNYISALRLKERIKKEKIDIIHSNSSVINIGGILSKLYNIPHVWHIREFGQEDFNFHYVFSKKYTLNFINENSNAVLTVSSAIYEKMENSINNNKLKVVYNGIDKSNFNEKLFTDEYDSINIILSGRISEAKGQREAVLAFNELVRRGYQNVKLHFAGSGNSKEIVDLVNQLGLHDKIILLGKINNLVKVRKKMNLELVCSKNEAFGRVTIEAMMGRLPVIGANTGGTKELIKDGYNGLLYNQGEYIDLADKIESILVDTSKIEYMGTNAYEFSKNFTADINAKKIYEVYQDIK